MEVGFASGGGGGLLWVLAFLVGAGVLTGPFSAGIFGLDAVA